MPLITTSLYQPPYWLPNGHFQTVFPSLFRKVENVVYKRERINTPDHDFLDLDWAVPNQNDMDTLFIISHGLEGDSHRQYVKGMVKALNNEGYACLAWNYRSCSGEINKQVQFYHSGATYDLDYVIRHALSQGYKSINLIGFSLGGNLTLKWLGEQHIEALPFIKKALVFSVPLHLSSGSKKLESWQDWIYTIRFNKSLKKKILAKAAIMPNEIDISHWANIKTLRDFDNYYTARLHGFKDAEDYYQQNSSIYFLDKIVVPTLIVNALNDPFLSEACFPIEQLEQHPYVWLQIPNKGGHCGFYQKGYQNKLWSEERAVQWFFNS
jgi:uncharacterized protein